MAYNSSILFEQRNIYSFDFGIHSDGTFKYSKNPSSTRIVKMSKMYDLKINNKTVTDESRIIDQSDFDNNNNMKVSHGKKQHIIVKAI